jgi:effector-binding domain-containing protein
MNYHIELTDAEPATAAVIRGVVPWSELPQFVPAACGEVWQFIRAHDLPQPGRHIALYLDAQGTTEVGTEVGAAFEGNERVQCSQLPAGRVATAVHYGPYHLLGEAHNAIRQWCVAQGYQLSDVAWEIYGHWDESWNSDPSKIRTDVFHLIRA